MHPTLRTKWNDLFMEVDKGDVHALRPLLLNYRWDIPPLTSLTHEVKKLRWLIWLRAEVVYHPTAQPNGTAC
jgi:hypothetical protein